MSIRIEIHNIDTQRPRAKLVSRMCIIVSPVALSENIVRFPWVDSPQRPSV